MFSNARTNYMCSNSAAQAHGAICLFAWDRDQSPKQEKNLHRNLLVSCSVTFLLIFKIKIKKDNNNDNNNYNSSINTFMFKFIHT